MGGVKRFFCHYCNSHFPYSREGRKKHNEGQTHKRNHEAHYQQFWTPKQRYEREMQKEKCRKFLSGQGCPYGDECRFSHLTQDDLQQLEQQAKVEDEIEEYGELPSQLQREDLLINSADIAGAVISFVNSRRKQKIAALLNPEQDVASAATVNESATLSLYLDLPPSLQPSSVEDFLKEPPAEWGKLS